ncbi:MAG: hypothetical protein A2V66_02020 [Ignavibacteria bacterium RBG_13_36_8]|nr:MAG: hypothetical protein A2V66_02020 [Ignavibacteria bacterium RBG_13_36_8]
METKKADLSSLRIDSSKRDGYEKKGKKSYLYIISLVIIVVVAIVIYWVWNSLFSPAVEVKLTTASFQLPSQTDAVLTASGYVVAQRKAAVASKGTGRLVYLGVVEGDKVKTNQIIARLEDNDIKAQLDQAKANLKLTEADLKEAETNYNRQVSLLPVGATTQMEVDAAEARLNRVKASIEVAKAQVVAAEVALENMLIRAPFDGTVLTKNADVGEIVAPLAAGANSKAAVVTIADMSSLQVEADVSESNIEKIKSDQPCDIVLDAYPQSRYSGYVDKIVPTADRSKATVLVKVGFRNYDSRVLPEMSAKVVFLKENSKQTSVEDEKQILMIPETSIALREGKQVVYVVKENHSIEIPVITGRVFGGYVEIIAGLENGDQIISNVSENIVDGIEVIVK